MSWSLPKNENGESAPLFKVFGILLNTLTTYRVCTLHLYNLMKYRFMCVRDMSYEQEA